MKYKIINCITDLGLSYNGTELGPKLISNDLNNSNIEEIYNIYKDNIEKSYDKNDLAKNIDGINNFTKKHYKLVSDILNKNYFPISIGGDHSIAIGSALACNNFYKDIGIIWIDAHSDYNNFDTTLTGNIHGMPLAAITGYKCDKLTDFLNCSYVNPRKCSIIGARDIDEKELVNLKDAGINVYKMEDVKKYGIENILEKAFVNGGKKLHISYDLDGIDPVLAPGVSTKAENGLTLEDSTIIMKYIKDNIDKVKSFDLVEYNPLNDIDNKTKDIAIDIINKFINIE